jgi:hypothetical protein
MSRKIAIPGAGGSDEKISLGLWVRATRDEIEVSSPIANLRGAERVECMW